MFAGYICWPSIGLPFLLVGLAIRQGWTKKWFLHTQYVPYMPSASVYGFIPLGLGFCLSALVPILPIGDELKADLFLGIPFIGILLALIFPLWKPSFLKPIWLKRLESQYSPNEITLFQTEWKTMDRNEWSNKIGTEEGLQELVALVTSKYGEYDPERYVFSKAISVNRVPK